VVVLDVLSVQVRFRSSRVARGSYDPATGIWTVGNLAAGATETLTITVLVVSPNPQANTASASRSAQSDPNVANNSGTASVNPQQADLALSKTVDNPTPNVGDTVTFTITLTDNGPNNATGVSVTDLLPAGLTLVSAAPGQGTYDPATGLWNVGSL